MSTDGVVAAAFIPDDGYLDPSQLTFSLADAARRLGAQLELRTTVTGIETRDGRVVAVVTDKGRVECDVVVDAAGMYAPQVARLVGVDLPIIPYGHQYLITEPFTPPLEPLPTLRDPDNLIYFRTEVGGLVMGGYERKPAPWALDGIPDGFEAKLLPEEWDRMEELFSNAITRVPAMENAEVKKFFNGPEAFTPDADFLLGETDVPGFWVAAGGCAHGLAGAGGVGKVMGEWIVDGRPEWDVWPLDVRRFGRQYRSQAYTLVRSYEALSQYYDIKYPGEEKQAGRPLRVSPAYARHQTLGASFGEKGGWERVNWYESNAASGDESLRPRGLGRRELVAGDRGRGARGARGDRALRPVVVLEARGARPRRARVPRRAVREPHRPSGGNDRVHAAAECARRDRSRSLRHASRRATGSCSSPAPRSARTTARGSRSMRRATARST